MPETQPLTEAERDALQAAVETVESVVARLGGHPILTPHARALVDRIEAFADDVIAIAKLRTVMRRG